MPYSMLKFTQLPGLVQPSRTSRSKSEHFCYVSIVGLFQHFLRGEVGGLRVFVGRSSSSQGKYSRFGQGPPSQKCSRSPSAFYFRFLASVTSIVNASLFRSYFCLRCMSESDCLSVCPFVLARLSCE